MSKVFFASNRNFFDEVKKKKKHAQILHVQVHVNSPLNIPFAAVHITDQLHISPRFRTMGKLRGAGKELRKHLPAYPSSDDSMKAWGQETRKAFLSFSTLSRCTIMLKKKKRKEITRGTT